MIKSKIEVSNSFQIIKHMGFIMDGNRRYAKKQNLTLQQGYKKGMEKLLEFVSFQIKYKVSQTSFFALSADNGKNRTKEELETIFGLIEFFSNNEKIEEFFKTNKVKINLKGDIDELEKDSIKLGIMKKEFIKNLKNKFDDWNKKIGEEEYIVNIALNYGGQKEIAYACKRICEKVMNGELKINKINEKIIKENSWFNDVPADIIVRPGDAPRLSGFMLFDSEYSEIYLTKKLWPELDETDFIGIIEWFKSLKRNFGK